MSKLTKDNGFDAQVKDVERVHIERLSGETIAVNVYTYDGKLKVFHLASESLIAIREQDAA